MEPRASKNCSSGQPASSGEPGLVRVEVLEAMLLEYRKAIHDIANNLAAAGLHLDLCECGGTGDTTALVAVMRASLEACSQTIQRLHAARDGQARQ